MAERLSSLRDSHCVKCELHSGASTVCVFGEGPEREGRLPVMVLGEAPGRDEDKTGRPFVGLSGKLLRAALLEAGIPPKRVYITNTVKCFPHGTPTPKQQAICSGFYLRREIDTLAPRYILAVGSTALNALRPGYKISEVRGQVLDCWYFRKAFVVAVWHPAYILRNKSKTGEWKKDIEAFKTLVEIDHGL